MILLKKILKWTLITLLVLFVVAELIRWPFRVREERTAEQVQIIHNTKIKVADVMGNNLPPDPGVEADKTIAGIDANQNGIRDDVELAIFNKYPNSAKTRSALLQYALALQMETNQPVVNEYTVTEVVREQSRADACVSDTISPRKTSEASRTYADIVKIDKYIDFVKSVQYNTVERKGNRENFVKKVGSFSESENKVCDIDYSTLVN